MRHLRTFSLVLCAVVLGASIGLGQSSRPDWLPCARCQTDQQRADALAAVKGRPFDPRDLSGIWGRGGADLSSDVPPMTPWGQAKFNAAIPGHGPRAQPLGNDPMMICDPLGYPRWLTYNYGMEFVQIPGRVLQFFEFYHTYRTIWTDGRALPRAQDIEPRWLGYAVGRWDGNTFVVESTGYSDRPWTTELAYPQSEQMRIVERYRRASYDTLDVEVTIDDPKAYTKPWVSKATIRLSPNTEMGEYFCVPSDEAEYLKTVRERAGGVISR